MSSPRVSVCIITRNHERYIGDCLMSVVAQSEAVPLEILVGDDGSTDHTAEVVGAIAQRFPGLIQSFRNDPALGGCENLQFLLGKARAPYVAHLDGDDSWLPGKLARQVALLDQNPHLSACYTNALWVDDAGVAQGVFNNPQPREFGLDYLLADGNFLNHSSLLYRAEHKDVFRQWPVFLDYRIHLLLASKGTLGYLNELGVAYRRNSSTSTMAHQNELVRKAYWEALESVEPGATAAQVTLSAHADFLVWVLARSVRERTPQLIGQWWRVVAEAHQQELGRLARHALENALSTGARKALTQLGGLLGGTKMRVLYWR
jgi:glycosyltransferase involved in cell wall biosynthesis